MALGQQAAEAHAECCICFDDLCTDQVAAFTKESKRVGFASTVLPYCVCNRGGRTGSVCRLFQNLVCPHFFHWECVKDMCGFVTRGYGMEMEVEEDKGGMKKCPMCREEFSSIVQLPDPVENPKEWFRLVDWDNSGELTKEEVRDVIKATCDVSEDGLMELISEKWLEWDESGNGGLDEEEIPGLIKFVKENLPKKTPQKIPHICEDKEEWFSFWDEDNSGELEKDEVARALIKTFEKDRSIVSIIQNIVGSIWPLFDDDASLSISKDEFTSPDGLADTVIASLQGDPVFAATAREALESSAIRIFKPLTTTATLPRNDSDDPSQDESDDDEPGLGPWKCKKCTFMNTEPVPTCGVCQAENPNLREVQLYVREARIEELISEMRKEHHEALEKKG